jgi:hypothetical protein
LTSERRKTKEYLRRNLIVCGACGAEIIAKKAIERVRAWKHQPNWLLAALAGIYERVHPTKRELAEHRDEIRLKIHAAIHKSSDARKEAK